jgi:hypothetical protein
MVDQLRNPRLIVIFGVICIVALFVNAYYVNADYLVRRRDKGAMIDQSRNPRLIAVVFAVSCIVVLTVNGCCLAIYRHISGGMLVLCSIIGGLVGWAVAVLATPAPENPNERLQFNAYAKVISVFLSGFLFTKLNSFFTAKRVNSFLERPDNLAQVGFASGYTLAFFLIGLMWTFLVRRYTQARGAAQSDTAKTDKSGGNGK